MDGHTFDVTTFRVGQVLGETFGVIGRNFWKLVVLCAIVEGLRVGGSFLHTPIAGPSYSFQPSSVLVRNLLDSVVSTFLTAGATLITYEDMSGGRADLATILRVSLRVSLPLVGLTLVTLIPIGIGFVLLAVPGILLGLRWFVAAQVRVIEGPGLTNALTRSAVLTSGHRWQLLGLAAILILLSAVLLAITPLLSWANGHQAIRLGSFNVGHLMGAVMGALVGLLVSVGYAATYTALRRAEMGGLTSRLAAVFD